MTTDREGFRSVPEPSNRLRGGEKRETYLYVHAAVWVKRAVTAVLHYYHGKRGELLDPNAHPTCGQPLRALRRVEPLEPDLTRWVERPRRPLALEDRH